MSYFSCLMWVMASVSSSFSVKIELNLFASRFLSARREFLQLMSPVFSCWRVLQLRLMSERWSFRPNIYDSPSRHSFSLFFRATSSADLVFSSLSFACPCLTSSTHCLSTSISCFCWPIRWVLCYRALLIATQGLFLRSGGSSCLGLTIRYSVEFSLLLFFLVTRWARAPSLLSLLSLREKSLLEGKSELISVSGRSDGSYRCETSRLSSRRARSMLILGLLLDIITTLSISIWLSEE